MITQTHLCSVPVEQFFHRVSLTSYRNWTRKLVSSIWTINTDVSRLLQHHKKLNLHSLQSDVGSCIKITGYQFNNNSRTTFCSKMVPLWLITKTSTRWLIEGNKYICLSDLKSTYKKAMKQTFKSQTHQRYFKYPQPPILASIHSRLTMALGFRQQSFMAG